MILKFLAIYFFCQLTALITISTGIFIDNKILKFKNNLLENGLVGVVFLSFIALVINFFIPLNKQINNIFFLFLIYPIFILSIKEKLILFKLSAIIAIIAALTLILDHVNRPDGGLYHLPYVNILNDNKLIAGLINLHFRFAHTSILQYFSAIFNNSLFDSKGILIPVAIIYGIVVCFFFNEIIKIENNKFLKIVSFILLLVILVSMNRYSGFGNDDPAHFFYFISVFYFMKCFNNNQIISSFNKLLIFSFFSFLLKQFYLLTIIYPALILIFNYKKFFKINISISFIAFFFLIWILKNILISSCMLYPVKITCFESLKWHPKVNEQFTPKYASNSNEAWAKGYPDLKKKNINEEEYISNYKWISTWSKNHLIYIFEKISFIILILIITSVILKIQKIIKKINTEIKCIKYLLFINLLFTLIWFFKFPTYRYGAGYILITIIMIFLYLMRFKYNNFNFLAKIHNAYFIMFLIVFTIVVSKNIIRIYNKHDVSYHEYPWPKKYSWKNEIPYENRFVEKDKVILYYKPSKNNNLCMYGKSPCTHFDVNIEKSELLGFYEVFYESEK